MQVAGVYAYAVRKTFNWVPEALVRQALYVEGGETGEQAFLLDLIKLYREPCVLLRI